MASDIIDRGGARGDPDGGATFPDRGLSFICRVKLPTLGPIQLALYTRPRLKEQQKGLLTAFN